MKKKLLFIAVAITAPVILIGLRRNSAPFFSVKEYQCVQDSLLSDDYFSSINSALADLCNEHCAAHVIIDRLKQQFPVLDKITISYRPAATRITLSVHEPVCCVNNSVMFTDNKELFSKNMFAEDACVDIPHIHVAQDSMNSAPQLISSFLQKLPRNTSNHYNLELMNPYCVHFTDKQQPQFTIVSSVAQEKLEQSLAQCAAIKQTIDEKKGFEKGIKWIADTRFAHYIVAYKA
jgi:hypothetical protein